MKSSFLDVLSIAPFRNLWLAQVISQITVNMLTFVLGVLIYQHTKSNTAVSILYLTAGLPAALFGILSGVYVDRFNKKKLLISTTLIRAILLGMMYFFQKQILILYILTVAISIVSQFFIPAEASLIPHYVPKPMLLTANSLFTLTFYSAIIGGFVAGGPILAFAGENVVLVLLMFLFILATFFLWLVPNPILSTEIGGTINFAQIRSDVHIGLSFIRHNAPVFQAILLLTLSQAVIAVFATLGPGFADRILAIRLTDASVMILGPAAFGMIVGALSMGFVGRLFSKRTLIKLSILLSGFLLLFVVALVYLRGRDLIDGIPHKSLEFIVLPLSVASFFLLGVANSAIDVTCNTVLQERTIEEVRGKVYGVLASLVGGVAIIPVVISGVLADVLGIEKIIIIMGSILIMIGVFIHYEAIRFENRLLPK
jgi:MFS family permease